jgi:hypothetical protein
VLKKVPVEELQVTQKEVTKEKKQVKFFVLFYNRKLSVSKQFCSDEIMCCKSISGRQGNGVMKNARL